MRNKHTIETKRRKDIDIDMETCQAYETCETSTQGNKLTWA